MLFAELEVDVIAVHLRARDRRPCDGAIFVLNLHVHVVVRQDLFPEFENLHERAGVQAMIDIIGNPRLQHAGVFAVVQFAAAVDETLRHMPNFRNVIMRGDMVAIRQDKTRERVRIRAQD